MVMTLVPNVIADALIMNAALVWAKPAVFHAPGPELPTLNVPDTVSASACVMEHPTKPSMPAKVTPFVVIVLPEPCKENDPLYVRVIPANSVTLPYGSRDAVPAQEIVPLPEGAAAKFRSKHVAATSTVTAYAVAFDAALKIALSAAVGTVAPLAPPDVVDQWAVSDQLPVPPTQYRSAIYQSSVMVLAVVRRGTTPTAITTLGVTVPT